MHRPLWRMLPPLLGWAVATISRWTNTSPRCRGLTMPQLPELQRQIEDLAVKLMANESGLPASTWVATLERIRETATREQTPEVLAAANAILQQIANTASGEPTVSLQAGLGRLQDALNREQNAPAPGELSLAQDPELIFDFILESREHL